jgi:hypothetical protein
MTREDAYFERILLLSGFWDGYDEWLGFYLENEDPLSDIVLELIDCKDIKAAEYCLGLYCQEKPFDEGAVHERLRVFLRDSYKSGKMTKDLAILIGDDQPWLATGEFMDTLDENLRRALA